MNTYRIYLIGPADRFYLSNYPELEAQLSKALPHSTSTPIDATASMFLSFAKHHWLNSRLAVRYPELADRIGSKDIPLSVLEQLFEASRP
ncbi:hypothetical protein EPD60_16585 [Flaviaesturariibacter flavus]|uniref:Uncharacterized protein n=1 Tax=Flaviaesturariibacter flavus TaxID=2502780 RepID=A0A4R1B845_9BACT|nr:hypothetical protein [Flaviaesturariibacter flavus]TCJ12163.1 hypothetical protein EPD60_16585 [Flaviaesturariibacter flavus]